MLAECISGHEERYRERYDLHQLKYIHAHPSFPQELEGHSPSEEGQPPAEYDSTQKIIPQSQT